MLATAANKKDVFNVQAFSARKKANTYRIFCLGGSTTFGRPYDDRTSFAGWLRAFLAAADPSRTWEVINAGGISYASYRVAALMDELSRYEPIENLPKCGAVVVAAQDLVDSGDDYGDVKKARR